MMNDNEHSNVVDNLSLLINPVGACRLTAEQQLEALKDAIGCSEGQDWQDQTWVERLIELIDRPTCKMSYDESLEDECPSYYRPRRCSVCGDSFIYYKYDPLNFCPNCGAEVQE